MPKKTFLTGEIVRGSNTAVRASELSAAKILAKAEKHKADVELMKALISNPVVEIVGAYVIIESLQATKMIGNVAGTAAEAGCLAAVALQQLAPLAPYIAESAKGIGSTVAKVAPLLAMAGA